MIKKNKDNAVIITSYLLKKLGIKYTDYYLSKQLQTHPFYPSLAAVSDVFTSYSIESEALRVSYEDLLDLQTPFIAHLNIDNGFFIIVERAREDGIFFNSGEKILKHIKKEEFIKFWNNIVFQAIPSTKSEEPNFVKHRRKEQLEKIKIPAMVTFVLFSFLSCVLIKPAMVYLLPLFFAKMLGLFFAILLVMQELGYHSEIAAKLCTMSKSAGCNEVLKSKASKLFSNVFLADVGLIWFTTSALYLLFVAIISTGMPALTLLGWLAVCSAPMILFSISYQIFIIKKYCPLCLGVMLALIIEIILFPVVYHFRFQLPHISEILMMGTMLCITAFIWFALKHLLIKNTSLQNSEIQYFHLRRKPHVIESQLMESDAADMSKLPTPIRLTDNDTNMTLTTVINLYCNPCKRAFEKIKYLLAEVCKDTVNVNVILMCDTDDHDDVITKTTLHFMAIAAQHPFDYTKAALFDWFDLKDYNVWSKKYPVSINNYHLTLLKSHVTWFNENKLEGTPVFFLNNKKIPYSIDLEDLQYLIND